MLKQKYIIYFHLCVLMDNIEQFKRGIFVVQYPHPIPLKIPCFNQTLETFTFNPFHFPLISNIQTKHHV